MLQEWLACLGDKALRHAWLGILCSVIVTISEQMIVSIRGHETAIWALRAIWPYSCKPLQPGMPFRNGGDDVICRIPHWDESALHGG